MKKIIVLLTLVVGSVACADVITWDASSGLLPYDNSIEATNRFEISGNSSWLSLQDGAMNVNDNSSTYQLGIGKSDVVPSSRDSNWAFQIELQMNSHSRPVFDFGATAGVTVQDKRSYLTIASYRIGFGGNNEFVNGQVYLMDTTDGFHTYHVIKDSDIVSLYVDTFDTPVMSIAYDAFPVYADHGTSVVLTNTSNPGLANYDIKSFVYNTDGTVVPEPTTLSLFALGVLALRKRKA